MEEYKFWDDDVEKAENQASIGNADVVEIMFRGPIEALNIHKDDVIHLAKQFGLAVYEKDSEL